jgi:1,2-diacylglycerol 3-beta-galactosyltransferase
MGALRWAGGRLARPAALRQLVAEARPDVIVSVIADFGPLGRLFELLQPPPVVTVISDLVTVHPAWLTPQVRMVVVPTEPAYAACRQLGMPAERLRLVGYPIRSHLFCRAGEPNGHKLEGGLRVLMMGGTSGSGRIIADVQGLLDANLRLALMVVCGKNAALKRAVEALAPNQVGPARLRVLGYTDDVPDLMRAADLLLTKAGPSTLFEAVASQLPAIITGHLPGQETGNSQYFAGAGVALEAPTPADTVRLVRRFVEDPGQLRSLRNAALRRETCQAAGQIAALILETAAAREPQRREARRTTGG